jgi:hypothetical protein
MTVNRPGLVRKRFNQSGICREVSKNRSALSSFCFNTCCATHTLSALALAPAVSLLPLPMPYCVEYNPSGFQAWPKCKCKQRIEEGDLRWGSHDQDDWSIDGHTYWSHLACVSHKVFQNAVLAHGSLAAIPGAAEDEYDLLDELEDAAARAETVRAKSHDSSFPRLLNFV